MLFQNTIQKTMPLILGFAIVAFAGQAHAVKLPKGLNSGYKTITEIKYFDCTPDRLKKNQVSTCRGKPSSTRTEDRRTDDGTAYWLTYKMTSCSAKVASGVSAKVSKKNVKPGTSSTIQVKATKDNTWVGKLRDNSTGGYVSSPVYSSCKGKLTKVKKM